MTVERTLQSMDPPTPATGAPTRWVTAFLALWLCCVTLIRVTRLGAAGTALGTDLPIYARAFDAVSECHCLTPHEEWPFEPLWSALMLTASAASLDFSQWLMALAGLQIVLWATVGYVATRSCGLPRDWAMWSIPLAYLVATNYAFVSAGTTNLLRAGLAIPLAAIGTILITGAHWRVGLAFAIVPLLVQTEVTSIMLVGMLTYRFLPRRWALFFLALGGLSYAVGVSTAVGQSISPNFMVDRALSYGSDSIYRSGTRIDFLLFTVILVVALWLLADGKSPHPILRNSPAWLAGLAAPFLLVGGTGAFSDRWLQPLWAVSGVLIALFAYSRSSTTIRFLVGAGAMFLSSAAAIAVPIY